MADGVILVDEPAERGATYHVEPSRVSATP